MHELSIVSSVLEQLDELKKQHEGARISKVGLRVGELAGVDVDCLRFGFECMVKDTEWEPLALEIETGRAAAKMSACDAEFRAENWATAVSRMRRGSHHHHRRRRAPDCIRRGGRE